MLHAGVVPYLTVAKITAKLDLLDATYDTIAGQAANYTSLEDITISLKKLDAVRTEMLAWERMLDERNGTRKALRVIRMRGAS